MKIPHSLFTFLLLIFINDALSQDILKKGRKEATGRDAKILNVLSLDGKAEKVEMVPDYVHHQLKIGSLRSAMVIDDLWGVPPDIKMLGKSFVAVSYAVRGGSNLGLANVLIICIKGGKLYQAMHALSYINSDYGDDKANYHIKWILQGNSERNYRLIVDIRDEVYSKGKPENDYVYHDLAILNFDISRNAFYSVKSDKYEHRIKTTKGEHVISGNFPTILLGKEAYYLVNGKWYRLRAGTRFEEFK